MSYQNLHREPSIALMAVIAFLAIVPTLWAQTERRTPQGTSTAKGLIFKSKGVSQSPADQGAQSSALPTFSVVRKNQLLKSLNLPPLTGPGSIYMRLNPRDTYVSGKGYLRFENPDNVDGGAKSAYWGSVIGFVEDASRVEVHLKSEAAGRRYLIDCSVKHTTGDEFKIWNGNDLLQLVQAGSPNGQHLAFVLDATTDGWHKFQISGGSGWYFHFCEVTRL